MYVLGVDGGTTKTIALVADEQGRVLGAARGGGSNWSGEDVTVPMGVVIETAGRALAQANITGAEVALGVFTLAGADWPEDHTRRESVLGQAGICGRVVVKNDAFGGLRAGTSAPYGMVIAAGTGLNAAVITPQGQEWAFGYYETFGGAGTLAWDAFDAVLRAETGRGRPTALTALLLEQFGYPTVEAMLRAYILRQIDPQRYLSIVPRIFEAALAGDAAAAEIIVRQGSGLAEYVTAMAQRFDMTALAFDVVLAGSIFKGVGPLLIDTVTQQIHKVAPRAAIVRASLEPAAGALLLAYDAAQIAVTPQMMEALHATLPGAAFFSTADG